MKGRDTGEAVGVREAPEIGPGEEVGYWGQTNQDMLWARVDALGIVHAEVRDRLEEPSTRRARGDQANRGMPDALAMRGWGIGKAIEVIEAVY